MPRKHKDPIHGVLDYFKTAPPEAAKLALSLADEIVKDRTPKAAPITKARTRRAAGPGPAPATVGD